MQISFIELSRPCTGERFCNVYGHTIHVETNCSEHACENYPSFIGDLSGEEVVANLKVLYFH